MKRFLTAGLFLLGLGITTARAQNGSYQDDIYFSSKEAKQEAAKDAEEQERQRAYREQQLRQQQEAAAEDDTYSSSGSDYSGEYYSDNGDYMDENIDDDYEYSRRLRYFGYNNTFAPYSYWGWYDPFMYPWYRPYFTPGWSVGIGFGGGPYWNSYIGWSNWYGYPGFGSYWNYPGYAWGWGGGYWNGWGGYYGPGWGGGYWNGYNDGLATGRGRGINYAPTRSAFGSSSYGRTMSTRGYSTNRLPSGVSGSGLKGGTTERARGERTLYRADRPSFGGTSPRGNRGSNSEMRGSDRQYSAPGAPRNQNQARPQRAQRNNFFRELGNAVRQESGGQMSTPSRGERSYQSRPSAPVENRSYSAPSRSFGGSSSGGSSGGGRSSGGSSGRSGGGSRGR